MLSYDHNIVMQIIILPLQQSFISTIPSRKKNNYFAFIRYDQIAGRFINWSSFLLYVCPQTCFSVFIQVRIIMHLFQQFHPSTHVQRLWLHSCMMQITKDIGNAFGTIEPFSCLYCYPTCHLIFYIERIVVVWGQKLVENGRK